MDKELIKQFMLGPVKIFIETPFWMFFKMIARPFISALMLHKASRMLGFKCLSSEFSMREVKGMFWLILGLSFLIRSLY